jgi:ABC-type transport system involved in cytochrome c biogenesis permease subunit
MLDLETRIASWRQTVAAVFPGNRDLCDELESHLRDDLDARLKSGATLDSSWAAAVGNLGSPQVLAAEYAGAVTPIGWWPISLVGASFALIVAYFTWLLATWFFRGPEPRVLLALHVGTIVLGYLLAFAAGALGVFYVATSAFRSLELGQRARLANVLRWTCTPIPLCIGLGTFLGAIWARENLGFYWDNDPREIASVGFFLWSAGLGLAWWLFPRRQHAWILLGVIGNGLASFCWFGARYLSGLHSYGTGWVLWMVFYVSLFHGLIACLGLLPPGWLRRAYSSRSA